MTLYSINFNFHKTSPSKMRNQNSNISYNQNSQFFFRFRIYLSMAFHLCISFYSKAFLKKKIGGVSFGSVPRNIPWKFLLIKRARGFGILNRCVRRTGAIQTTLNQLRAKILYDLNTLPQNYVQRYVTSMRRRCIAVVNIRN